MLGVPGNRWRSAGVCLGKEDGTSAGGAPIRGRGRAGEPGDRRGRGVQGRYPEGEAAWGVCTEGPRQAGTRAEAEPAGTRAAAAVWGGCSGVSPPPSAYARRTGGPHLLAGPRREGAGAPGVALAATWAGAGPSSTKRH